MCNTRNHFSLCPIFAKKRLVARSYPCANHTSRLTKRAREQLGGDEFVYDRTGPRARSGRRTTTRPLFFERGSLGRVTRSGVGAWVAALLIRSDPSHPALQKSRGLSGSARRRSRGPRDPSRGDSPRGTDECASPSPRVPRRRCLGEDDIAHIEGRGGAAPGGGREHLARRSSPTASASSRTRRARGTSSTSATPRAGRQDGTQEEHVRIRRARRLERIGPAATVLGDDNDDCDPRELGCQDQKVPTPTPQDSGSSAPARGCDDALPDSSLRWRSRGRVQACLDFLRLLLTCKQTPDKERVADSTRMRDASARRDGRSVDGATPTPAWLNVNESYEDALESAVPMPRWRPWTPRGDGTKTL